MEELCELPLVQKEKQQRRRKIGSEWIRTLFLLCISQPVSQLARVADKFFFLL